MGLVAHRRMCYYRELSELVDSLGAVVLVLLKLRLELFGSYCRLVMDFFNMLRRNGRHGRM